MTLELNEGTGKPVDGDIVSSADREISFSQEPTLPILQKIMDLSSNIQVRIIFYPWSFYLISFDCLEEIVANTFY